MTFTSVFKKKVGIEKEIDSFLDLVSESGLIFIRGITSYAGGKNAEFQRQLDQIVASEHNADMLRRSIEDLLYRRTLIPESRGDVLRIIENMDSLLGKFKGAMWRLQIEQPIIEKVFTEDLLGLTDVVVKSVETVTLSVRAYFRDIGSVSDHMHKVSFWEKEADKLATNLQIRVFRHEGYSLCQKMQLRDLIGHIEDISNLAEDMADSLAIYVIKRSL
jgi:predicted phosphate transport protein (TIGR00153 family)